MECEVVDSMGFELTKDDILKYLELIDTKLKERGKTGEILLCGGAVMTLVYEARNATYDIDALFEPKEDMKEIIAEITQAHNLHELWLNDDVAMFAKEFEKLNFSEYKNFGHLTVRVLDAESMLVMKLVSARAESKDLSDAVVLMGHLSIKNVEQLYSLIDKCKFPLHPTVLAECKLFARQAFDVYNQQK